MGTVRLTINGWDAFSKWGILTTSNTLSALLCPPPLKEFPSFSSRLEEGARIDATSPMVDRRDLSLELQMTASSPEQFYQRMASFEEELMKGAFTLSTSDRPATVYHLIYNSCSQYTQFCRGIATLALKCTEPNPKDRSI